MRSDRVTVGLALAAVLAVVGASVHAEIQWDPPSETMQGQPHVLYLSPAEPISDKLHTDILALEGDGALVVWVTDATLFDYILTCWRCDNVILADVPYAADPSESEALAAYIAHGGLAVTCQTPDAEEEEVAVQVFKDGEAKLGDKAMLGPIQDVARLVERLIEWADCRLVCAATTPGSSGARVACNNDCDDQFVLNAAP